MSLTYSILFSKFLFETGDTVQVVYQAGSGTTPVFQSTVQYLNGFTGFRI